MQPEPAASINVRVGRGDLLRLLAEEEAGGMVPEKAAGSFCGYRQLPAVRRGREEPGESGGRPGGTVRPPEPKVESEEEEEAKLRFLIPVYAETRDPQPQEREEGEYLTDEELAVPDRVAPATPPLAPWSRLLPFLRSALGEDRPGHRVDTRRLVRMVARGEPLREVPRQPYRRWAPQAVVLLDWSEEMMPFWGDLDWFRQRLRRECGRQGVIAEVLASGPRREQLAKLPEGTPVLAISAMGQLVGDEGLREGWLEIGEWLSRRGHALSALLPCPRQKWSVGLATQWRCVVWDRAPRIPRHAGLRALSAQEHDSGTGSVMGLLAPATLVEPGLLRAVRILLGRGADVGAEYEAFFHEDAAPCPMWFSFKRGEQEKWLERELQGMEEGCREEADELIESFHRTCAAPIAAEALRRLAQRARRESARREAEGVMSRALERMRREAGRGEDTDRTGLSKWSIDLVESRMDRELRSGTQVAELYAAASHLQGVEEIEWPEDVDRVAGEEELRRLEEDPGVESRISLRLAGGRLVAELEGQGGEERGIVVASLAARRLRLGGEVQEGAVRRLSHRFRPGGGGPLELGNFPAVEAVSVESDLGAFHLRSIERPSWAKRMGYDEYGLYADLEIEGVGLRLRWIPPGRFWMGDESDGLRHEVTITEGYWMAATQTTQELWSAVTARQKLFRKKLKRKMSRFKGAQRPVENVSWEDCQKFCELLNELPFDLEFGLPTEAQWEYGCRAGTEGEFNGREGQALEELGWFGENSGSETHEVSGKLANGWGLFDMHGNVWEWCVDGRRSYDATADVDPVGQEGAERVVRGGCWGLVARYCRSAVRYWDAPGNRNGGLGFRLVAGQRSSRVSGAIGLWAEGAVAPWPRDWVSAHRTESGAVGRPEWANASGVDEFGRWVELIVEGIHFLFRWIPPGTFWMGSPEDEEGRHEREGPRHEVRLRKGIWMGESAVTQEQWEGVTGENPSSYKGERRPVETVSWEDCRGYAEKLNGEVEGLRASLPTEAQWEYACRAGTEGRFNGAKGEGLNELGWYDENSGDATSVVSMKKANGWGLYDMHGNVDEWCLDGRREYTEGLVVDPVGPLQEGAGRVVRGGSGRYDARNCRSAFRHWLDPGFRNGHLGFRLVAGQELPAPEAE